jgi:hypothetical protein
MSTAVRSSAGDPGDGTGHPGHGAGRGPWNGRPACRGRSIPDMIRDAGSPHPAGFLAGWARWAALAAFAGLVVAGLLSMRPNPPTAAIAAAVAVAAGVLLIQQRHPLLLYAALATAGIAVLGHDSSTNITWFAVCLIGIWCALVGRRRDIVLYWAGTLLFFAADWLWILDDRG